MRSALFFFGTVLLFLITFVLGADKFTPVDLVTVRPHGAGVEMVFKSRVNPEVIRDGRNSSLLFRGAGFVNERVPGRRSRTGVVRKMTVRNYAGKGGAVNILSSEPLRIKTKRTASDVIKVFASGGAASTAVRSPEKPVHAADAEAVETGAAEKKTDEAAVAFSAFGRNSDGDNTVNSGETDKTSPKTGDDFLAGLSGMKDDDDESLGNRGVMVIVGLLIMAVGGFMYYRKKRGGNDLPGSGRLIRLVEVHHLGLKEKLALMEVAGQYVLLFIKDREVQKISDFSGDDADRIRALVSSGSDTVAEDTAPVSSAAGTEKQKRTSSVFGKKLEALLARESKERAAASERAAEDDVFSTISRLRKLQVK